VATFVLIEKYTVGAGGASSVTLGSGGTIPQTYTDLVVKFSTRATAGNPELSIRFNGDTAANYTFRVLYTNNGTSAASFSESTYAGYNTSIFAYSDPSTVTASTFGNGEMMIPNYTSSNQKSASLDWVGENNGTAAYVGFTAAKWSGTSAITSISLQPGVGGVGANFAQYSTFYLYGILKA
jgi:hypothetical protein